jgi:hypothetical protein
VETTATSIKSFPEPFNEYEAKLKEERGLNPMIQMGKKM